MQIRVFRPRLGAPQLKVADVSLQLDGDLLENVVFRGIEVWRSRVGGPWVKWPGEPKRRKADGDDEASKRPATFFHIQGKHSLKDLEPLRRAILRACVDAGLLEESDLGSTVSSEAFEPPPDDDIPF